MGKNHRLMMPIDYICLHLNLTMCPNIFGLARFHTLMLIGVVRIFVVSSIIMSWVILHFPVDPPKDNWWIKILAWRWILIVCAFVIDLMGERVFLIKVSDNLMLWIAIFHSQNGQAIFWLLNTSNGPGNRVVNGVWYDRFSDVGGDGMVLLEKKRS